MAVYELHKCEKKRLIDLQILLPDKKIKLMKLISRLIWLIGLKFYFRSFWNLSILLENLFDVVC